ncbi:hypothetical protein BGZ70_007320, partial [Mortierella alpina]
KGNEFRLSLSKASGTSTYGEEEAQKEKKDEQVEVTKNRVLRQIELLLPPPRVSATRAEPTVAPDTSTPQSSRVNRAKFAQIVMTYLEQKCAIVSLGIDTLKTRLHKGPREHNLSPDQELPSQVKFTVNVISEMVRIGIEITRCAEMACALFIAETDAKVPSLNDSAQIRTRKEEIAQFVSHSGVFFGNLGNLFSSILAWRSPSTAGRPRADNAEKRLIEKVLSRYEEFLQKNTSSLPSTALSNQDWVHF